LLLKRCECDLSSNNESQTYMGKVSRVFNYSPSLTGKGLSLKLKSKMYISLKLCKKLFEAEHKIK